MGHGMAWHGITYHGSGHWIVTRRSTPSGNDESSVPIPALQRCARAAVGVTAAKGLSFGNLGTAEPTGRCGDYTRKGSVSTATLGGQSVDSAAGGTVAWHGRSVLAANTPCALLSTACLALPAM